MTLVAVINLRIQSESTKRTYTSYTEKKLLLESVLPVTAIKMICHLTVLVDIGLIISIQQIEICPSYSHFPETCSNRTARECNTGSNPVSVLIHNRLCRNLEEVLRIIFGYLISLCRKNLCEIAVTVKKTDSHQVHIHVTGFLKIVTCKNSETT